LVLFLIFGMALRQDSILRGQGYEPSFLASAVSLFDDSLFQTLSNTNANGGGSGSNASVLPTPPAPGSVTTLNTPATTRLAEGLFSSDYLYLYQGARYNLRVSLGDNATPSILKNYYVNFVRNGVVYTLDSRMETPVFGGTFDTRILTVSNRGSGVLDLAPGEYDGYINIVWDTGTQTIKFGATILPATIVVQPASAPIVIPQVLPPLVPAPVPTPTPLPTPVVLPVSPILIIEQLFVRDAYGVIQGGVHNYQNPLWAYARVYTNSSGFVYNLSLVSRSNSSTQYQISAGAIDGSGSRELSYPMPALNNISTGVYDLTLVAAPRLSNGGVGGFVTRKEQITLVNGSNPNPISVVIPPVVVPPTNNGDVTISGYVNLNTDNRITNRSCSDGGDAVNYSVLNLTVNTATLHMSPSSGCLAVGDEILLVNLQGTASNIGSVGNYEILKISSISGSTVSFTSNKNKSYGENGDSNIGMNVFNQRVMLQRVPNYNNLTVNSGATLTASAFNGIRGGVLAFRVNGTLNNNGKITADGLGYRGGWTPGMQGEGRIGSGLTISHCYNTNYYGNGTAANDIGGGSHHCYGSGAGGSGATSGANGLGNALSGAALTVSNSSKLILGGGGGSAAGALGGSGGGIVLVIGNFMNNSGLISSAGIGSPGPCGIGTYTYSGGGGAGGSIYLVGTNLNVGSGISVVGGTGFSCAYTGGSGGAGRYEIGSSL